MCVRKSVAFLLVLLVASSLLWAFPGRREQKALEIQEEQTVEATQISMESEAPIEEAEQKKDSEEPMKSAEITVIADSQESRADAAIEELKSLLEEQVSDLLEAESDIERLRSENEELYSQNACQSDEIAYLNGRIDKARSARFFADLKGLIGFREKLPTWGIGSDMGIRFRSGLMISAGASYMLGSFSGKPIPEWNLDNLTLSIGIGWEW